MALICISYIPMCHMKSILIWIVPRNLNRVNTKVAESQMEMSPTSTFFVYFFLTPANLFSNLASNYMRTSVKSPKRRRVQ